MLPCEDGIAANGDFLAVVDGATAKGTKRIDGKTPGRLAMELLCDAVVQLPREADVALAVARLTEVLGSFYTDRGLLEEMTRRAENRLTASTVIYSVHRREVWMIGDCQCRFGGSTYVNPKPADRILAGIRADILNYLIRKGHAPESLQAHDLGREWILPYLKDQCHFQNAGDAGPFAHAVLDGFPVNLEQVRVLPVPPQIHELILASDGYPLLADTLEETERMLAQSLAQDPLRVEECPSTKGLMAEYESFDDRTYLRISLQ